VYFANGDGVLQFDGINCEAIEILGIGARSLAKDDQGAIYVGGSGGFGSLESSRNSVLKFVLLLDILPYDDKVMIGTRFQIFFCIMAFISPLF
jgi:hypothetical protein